MGFLTKVILAVSFVALLVAEWHFSKARIQTRVRENKIHQESQQPRSNDQKTGIDVDFPPGTSVVTEQKIRKSVEGATHAE
ncbi:MULTISPECIES: hypothetical protein [Pseudomonas]|uniref:hypothetical protein n=1 Tax=Pseudomonas TaxID=286 RepID=UPI002911520C|nr:MULTISPECIES: hypothetical protein [Pseudomonas]MDU8545707.1 hypothetical protein [Pseudomonas syringae group sp. J248-6]WPP02634.1 hypothetical protein SFA35_26405 [Pseudomonas sp. HR96]